MKKIISYIFCGLTLLTLVSCDNMSFGSYNSSNVDINLEGYQLRAANVKANMTSSQFKEEGFKNFLNKIDTFAAKLSAEIYGYSDKYKEGNYTVSPISIYMALAMAIESSNSTTRQEMLDAVGVTYNEVITYTKYLYSLTNREFTYRDEDGEEKVSAFEMLRNSIWINDIVNLKNQGLDNLASYYHSDSYRAPFSSDNKLANQLLSDYVYENTKGLIDSNFNLSVDTIFALVNTFYLKEIWKANGQDLDFTMESYDFVNNNGEITNTKLLKGYYFSGQVYEEESFTHFYTKTYNGFKIKFIVPKEEYKVEDIFTEENLKKVNNLTLDKYNSYDEENNVVHFTRCLFPEYEASFDDDIKEVLNSKFNINYLFNDKCDMTNLTDIDVYCGEIIHKTKLKVNKEGVEGAAVTIMVNYATSAPGEDPYTYMYHDYIIDKSFGFILTDNYDVTLFSGVVNKI